MSDVNAPLLALSAAIERFIPLSEGRYSCFASSTDKYPSRSTVRFAGIVTVEHTNRKPPARTLTRRTVRGRTATIRSDQNVRELEN